MGGRPLAQVPRGRRAACSTCRAAATARRVVPEASDVVIIGSGIGGLCCAAIAARYGFSVTVLESHTIGKGAPPSPSAFFRFLLLTLSLPKTRGVVHTRFRGAGTSSTAAQASSRGSGARVRATTPSSSAWTSWGRRWSAKSTGAGQRIFLRACSPARTTRRPTSARYKSTEGRRPCGSGEP